MKTIKGKGSINKMADGKFRLRVSMGYTPDRRKIERSKIVYVEGRTEKEQYSKAQISMRRYITELEKEIGRGGNISFDAFFARWEDDYAKPQLEKGTLNWYRENTPIIREYFGNRKLNNIGVKDIDDFMKWTVTIKGKSKAYANTLLKILKAILQLAVKWEWIDRNPCEKVTPFKVPKTKISVYNTDMALKMFDVLEKYPMQKRLYVYLPSFCGLRREEVVALRWANIDLQERKLYVKEAARYAGKEFGVYLKPPKTEDSERTIDIPEFLIEPLKLYKTEQRKTRLLMGPQWEMNDFVFINEENGKMIYPDSLSCWFRRFIKRHGLNHITYHGLRHTFASLLLKSNVDIASISKTLGHSNVSTTIKIYIHGVKEAEREIADVMDKKFGPTLNRTKEEALRSIQLFPNSK
jgi:integrase